MKRSLLALPILAALAPMIVFAKPVIGPVTPVTASAGVAVNLSATVSSSAAIQRCSLWVDLAEVGEMNVSGGNATRVYTFPSGGSRIAFVFCRDVNGGMSAGATTAISVSGATITSPPLSSPTPAPTPTPTPTPAPSPTPAPTPAPAPVAVPIIAQPPISPDAGKLLKAICPESAGIDHACRAVYYIGRDGKRHAFPNSRVFFTWYGNFDSVTEVPLATLSNYQLGANVLYRAGVRMVKFTTDPKVYAVARGGVLRWIKTEELARAYYGNEWNKKIDDISDSFYTNYSFGSEINLTSDYNPEAELANSSE